jgi:hypothetical protein
MEISMKIKVNADKATIARVGEVEFKKDGVNWRTDNLAQEMFYASSKTIQAMGATFETELEPEEGYRFADPEKDRGYKGPYRIYRAERPGWIDAAGREPWFIQNTFYAIPKEQPKPSVVEGEVIGVHVNPGAEDPNCVLEVTCSDKGQVRCGKVLVIEKDKATVFAFRSKSQVAADLYASLEDDEKVTVLVVREG